MTDWPRVLLRVRHRPRGHDHAEVLELALAGAVLEVDLGVLFEAAGVAHLSGAAGRPWRQFPDFDLGRLYVPVTDMHQVGVAACALGGDELTELLAAAGTVIDV